jgi:pimeloyl-ACP methyl ester carboxylesterase
MSTSRSLYFTLGGFETHVTAWGDPGAPALLAWHGLARTGRDFDTIAAALSDTYHVICPDTIGRGLSQWSNDPDRDYCLSVYADHARALADALGLGRFRYLGTSMGGTLGIVAGATTLRDRLSHLVINDIGPTFPQTPYDRIKTYVGAPPDFATMAEAEAYFRLIYTPFGAHTDAQWRHLAETSIRRLPNGRLTPHYDPAIARQFHAHPRDFERWANWDALSSSILVLRGVDSDLLTPDIAAEMTRRGPAVTLREIPGCGHAPALNTDAQIAIVRAFLA